MLLRPDITVAAAYDVDPELLRTHGIRAVMVDLDDTILPSDGEIMEPVYKDWLSSLKEAGLPVLILSNGERSRVARWASELGIPGLSLAGKPFWFAFRRGLRRLASPPSATAMIGDQLFTDVLGANLAGVRSILVSPLTAGKLPHTRFARRLERLVLRGGGHGRPVDR